MNKEKLIAFLKGLEKASVEYDPEGASSGGNFDDSYQYGWEGGEVSGGNEIIAKVLGYINEN
jgi:hypothetical protein